MARLTSTKYYINDASGYAINLTGHTTYYKPTYDEDTYGNRIKLAITEPTYLFGPAVDKLADYENIRDNPQEIREELHRGQIAWNENHNLKVEISDLKEENAYLQARYTDISNELEITRKHLRDDIALKQKAYRTIGILEEENKKIKKKLEEVGADNDFSQHCHCLKNNEFTKLYSTNFELAKENNYLKCKNESLIAEVKRKSEACDKATAELDRLQSRINNLIDTLSR